MLLATTEIPHTLFSDATNYLHKLFATAGPSKLSLKSNKTCEPTHLWLGLQSEGFVCSWSPLSSCISRLWVIRNTCSFPVLQMLMHRLSSDQGCLQCCQTQADHCYQAFVAPRLKICNLLNVVLVMGLFFPTGTWTSRHFIPMDTPRKKKLQKILLSIPSYCKESPSGRFSMSHLSIICCSFTVSCETRQDRWEGDSPISQCPAEHEHRPSGPPDVVDKELVCPKPNSHPCMFLGLLDWPCKHRNCRSSQDRKDKWHN